MIWLRSLAFNLSFYGWTVIMVLFCTPLVSLFGKPRAVFVVGRYWARQSLMLLRLLCGITHKIEGLENLPSGSFILASKHQSAWDTLIFSQLLDHPSYVLKRELTLIPFFGWALLRVGMIPVDRSGGAAALKKMLSTARTRVAEGRPIVIYPEGTRTAPGQTKPYHPGVAALYRDLGLPVVPVTLNSGRFWGRKSFAKTPGVIRLVILPAIPPGLPRRDFMTTLERQIEAAGAQL